MIKYLFLSKNFFLLPSIGSLSSSSILDLLLELQWNEGKLELWVTSLSDTPRLQYYDVQTLEYRYISKLPMNKEQIWSNVKETTSHLQNKLTKNIHLGVATRSSTKWDCLKSIRFHQYTWGLQHFLTFVQEDIGHIKCYWFKINYLFLSSFYITNIQMWKGQLKSYFNQE